MSDALEFPALSKHHLLEGDAFHAFRTAHEWNFPVLTATWMLIADDRPVPTASLRHRNYERIAAIDAFVGLRCVEVRRQEVSYNQLHFPRLFHEKLRLGLAPLVAIVARLNLIKHNLWRSQPSDRNQLLDAFLQAWKNRRRIQFNVPLMIELVSMQ
jgi:hypothetical protein